MFVVDVRGGGVLMVLVGMLMSLFTFLLELLLDVLLFVVGAVLVCVCC